MAGWAALPKVFTRIWFSVLPEQHPGIVIPNRFSGEESAVSVQMQIPLT
jgi:hypothetical protein